MRSPRKKMSKVNELIMSKTEFFSKMKLLETLEKIISENSDFTGQITIEVHCKDGIIKDVYVSNRSKIDN